MAEQDVKIQDFPSIFSLKGKVAVVRASLTCHRPNLHLMHALAEQHKCL
jgi:hypothetical protein